MAVALLSHILHPHPQVPSKIELNEPFLGAVLVSPWLNFATDFPNAMAKEKTDYVSATVGKRWSEAFLGSSPKDNYNQPCMAEPSWFDGLESIVKDVLIEAGGGEMLIDGINEMAETLKRAHKNVMYLVTVSRLTSEAMWVELMRCSAECWSRGVYYGGQPWLQDQGRRIRCH